MYWYVIKISLLIVFNSTGHAELRMRLVIYAFKTMRLCCGVEICTEPVGIKTLFH